MGAGFVRVDFFWHEIEPADNQFSFGSQWRDVLEAEARGLKIFVSLSSTPDWLGGHNAVPPSYYWDRFVTRAVQEFNGHVWYWGVWNEPDASGFLSVPSQYPYLVSNARSIIKAINPNMKVLGPEVSSGGVVNGYYAWFMSAYGSLVDIVTVHYYNDGSNETKWVDVFMDSRVYPYRAGKEVWMTETGRDYCHPEGQANHYLGVLERFEPRRSWWTRLFFYDLYRPAPFCSDAITDPNHAPRQAFYTYKDWIASHTAPPSPPSGGMQQDSAVRGCSGYQEQYIGAQASAAACESACSQQGANACEWYQNGDCYAEWGSGCYVQSGFSGWGARVFGSAPPPPPPSGPMQQDSAVRGCAGYQEQRLDNYPDANSCANACMQWGANACEWNQDGSCYAEWGSGCYVQPGFGGWWAAVFSDAPAPEVAPQAQCSTEEFQTRVPK